MGYEVRAKSEFQWGVMYPNGEVRRAHDKDEALLMHKDAVDDSILVWRKKTVTKTPWVA